MKIFFPTLSCAATETRLKMKYNINTKRSPVLNLCFVQNVLFALLFACPNVSEGGYSQCYTVETIDYSISQEYCDQPIFTNIVPKTEEFMLVDNICYTYFPLPDDPSTFTIYVSTVYCDGSYAVQTNIGVDLGFGQTLVANPFGTVHDYLIGYAGCDTYLVYRCFVFGGNEPLSFTVGFSNKSNPVGLSCLRKVEEIIRERGLPEDEYYILPMKLPNRCVTQQLCTAPSNPFYNKLPSVAVY